MRCAMQTSMSFASRRREPWSTRRIAFIDSQNTLGFQPAQLFWKPEKPERRYPVPEKPENRYRVPVAVSVWLYRYLVPHFWFFWHRVPPFWFPKLTIGN